MNSMLMGYVRKSNAGGALKVNLSADAFDKAQRYLSKDGEEFVGLVVNIDHVRAVMEGEKEVTSISQISD